MLTEAILLDVALVLYLASAIGAVVLVRRGDGRLGPVAGAIGLALAVHTVAIAVRWNRLDHGPYVDLFEILSSNVWSLHLAVLLGCLTIPLIRASLATVLPLLQVLTVWLIVTPARDTEAPVTYATMWLPIHVALGKVFLGLTLLAVGLSAVILLRRWAGLRFTALPDDTVVEELAYRLVLVAVIFETLTLIAGALWAPDAWGRYWAWDPLETSAFATWIAVIGFLHWRIWRRPSPMLASLMVIGVFVLAFSTFFGMPFISTAPHKGAI